MKKKKSVNYVRTSEYYYDVHAWRLYDSVYDEIEQQKKKNREKYLPTIVPVGSSNADNNKRNIITFKARKTIS